MTRLTPRGYVHRKCSAPRGSAFPIPPVVMPNSPGPHAAPRRAHAVFMAAILLAAPPLVARPLRAQRTAAPSTRSTPTAPTARSRTLATTLANDLIRVANLPGISVAALGDGRVVYAAGAGYRDLERRLPVDSTTQFAAASVSKIVAATAALRLYQAGRFDPDEIVARRFPLFPGGERINARLLAAHMAGIPHYGPGSMPSDKRYVWASDALGEFSAAPRVGEPGERSVYSTHGITLLTAMMERADGHPILEILRREVFVPFDMPSSGGMFLDSLAPTFATLYERSGGALRPRSRVEFSYSWGGAGLRHTPVDLVRMARPYFDGTFTPRTLQLAFEEQRTRNGTGTGIGFVWRVERDWRGRALAHHAGVNRGTRTVLLLRRDQKQAVAFMTNLEWTVSAERTANVFAEALFDEAPRRVPLNATGRWSGALDSTKVEGSWSIEGDSGWVSVPDVLSKRFTNGGGVTAERLPLRAIRDDLYALVTPWGLSPFEVTREADGTLRARVQIGASWWTLTSARTRTG